MRMVFVSIANYMNVLGYESHTNVDMNRFLYLPTKKKKNNSGADKRILAASRDKKRTI